MYLVGYSRGNGDLCFYKILQDRSLGAVELKVNDLAVADRDNHDFPYTSNGKIPRNSPIFLDKNISKGFLEYEAEFVPSLNIKGIEFDQRNELEKAVEEGARESGAHGDAGDDVASADGSVSSSDEEYEKVPEGITVGEPSTPTTPLTPSAPSRALEQRDAETTKNGTTVPSERNKSASPERGSVEISREQLLHTCKCNCHSTLSVCLTSGHLQPLVFSFSMSSLAKSSTRLDWRFYSTTPIGHLLQRKGQGRLHMPNGTQSARALSKSWISVVCGYD